MAQIFAFLCVTTLLITLWVMLFFIFDDTILKGHFKKKIQKRFGVI